MFSLYISPFFTSEKSIFQGRESVLDILKMVADKNDIMRLVNKIEVLDNIKSNLKRNSNIGLSIDKMVIDMCGEIYDW